MFILFLLLAATCYGQQTLNCSSEDGGRKVCPADTRGGVTMIRQRSGSPCVQGQTWGYDRGSVWVDRGCRADFAIGRGNGDRPGYGPGDRPGYGPGYRPGYGNNYGGQQINCSSESGGRKTCNIDTRGGVQMIRQRSGSPCIQGRTWGYNRNSIWVDKGCRADFIVGNRRH
ncbi:MAG: DUF3011 domain-containing protein [Acidobacteriaceae bacterium]